MIDRADAVPKLALAVAALLLVAGLGYYYGLFLPRQATTQMRDQQSIEGKSRLNHERQSVAKKEPVSAAAQATYMSCLAAARADYYTGWDKTCSALHDSESKALANCFAQGYEEEHCDVYYQVRPAVGCQLPGKIADSYNTALETSKQRCLANFRAEIR